MTGAIIIGVTYGLDVQQENDPNVLLAEKAIFSMAMTGVAGTYLGTALFYSVDHGLLIRTSLVDWLPQSTCLFVSLHGYI